MKMNKKMLVLFSVLLLLIGSIGGTIAYLTTDTLPIKNTFIPGKVDGEIEEDFQNNEKKNIFVSNTGNTTAFMRIKLVSYWYALNEDSIIAKDSWFDEATWSTTADNGWFYADGYFYYQDPVEPGEATKILFDESIILKEDAIGRQVLEILADAIQANPDDAVEAAWAAVDVDPVTGKLIVAVNNP